VTGRCVSPMTGLCLCLMRRVSNCVHCMCVSVCVAGGAMNSIGAGAVGGSNGCTVSGGAVGGAEAMQQYGAGAGTALSGLLNPGMSLLLLYTHCFSVSFISYMQYLTLLWQDCRHMHWVTLLFDLTFTEPIR